MLIATENPVPQSLFTVYVTWHTDVAAAGAACAAGAAARPGAPVAALAAAAARQAAASAATADTTAPRRSLGRPARDDPACCRPARDRPALKALAMPAPRRLMTCTSSGDPAVIRRAPLSGGRGSRPARP